MPFIHLCEMILQLLFWFSVACLVHSYVLYPLLLKIFAGNLQLPRNEIPEAQLPMVSVLLSVFNEEKVIEQKIRSVFKTNYPTAKLEMVIGSDGSTDKTDTIIQQLIGEGFSIRYERFGGRNGKSNILNALRPKATGEIFILTDANILFDENTIGRLVRHFNDPANALVAANIINSGMRPDGISHQEQTYIRRENLIKYREGALWGSMMGAFGACYAIRSEYFTEIPRNFLMEDFYISMGVLRAGKKCISDMEAMAYEDVSNLMQEEFKRKVRISAGNFQNLGVYYGLLKNPFSGVGFSFLSHKVLRWLGPFFLLIAFTASAVLQFENLFFRWMFLLQLLGFFTPVLDKLLSRVNIHTFALRLLAYFYSMNAALLLGFIRYLRGIRTNAWSPTQRNI